jgi:hypothetical protein
MHTKIHKFEEKKSLKLLEGLVMMPNIERRRKRKIGMSFRRR